MSIIHITVVIQTGTGEQTLHIDKQGFVPQSVMHLDGPELELLQTLIGARDDYNKVYDSDEDE